MPGGNGDGGYRSTRKENPATRDNVKAKRFRYPCCGGRRTSTPMEETRTRSGVASTRRRTSLLNDTSTTCSWSATTGMSERSNKDKDEGRAQVLLDAIAKFPHLIHASTAGSHTRKQKFDLRGHVRLRDRSSKRGTRFSAPPGIDWTAS